MSTITSIKPPAAKKINKSLNIHGHIRSDEYYWMNDRENPEVISYLSEENAYTKVMMQHTENLQEILYNEMLGRIKQTDMSVPYLLNGYYYYTRFEEGKEYPVFCRKKGNLDAREEIILNANTEAEGKSYYQVAGLTVSPDNKLLAFGEDVTGRRQYTIKIKNLITGEMLPDHIPNTSGEVAWANDNITLYYTVKDEALRPSKVFRHSLNTAPKEDGLVFYEDDEMYHVSVFKSKSRRFIMIASHSTLSDEYRYVDANNPLQEFKIIQKRERGLEYSVKHYEDIFYILTNLQATNFGLMSCPIDKTSKENWKEVIAHREDTLIENIEVFRNYLVLDERKNGLSQLRIMDRIKNNEHYISFHEAAYGASASVNHEFDTNIFRFGYFSLTTPNTVYDYNMDSREVKLLKQEEVLGGFKSEDYTSERLMIIARDGVKIPLSMVYKKGVKRDGKNPFLLYAYGSYGHSLDPYFSIARLSLLDREFIFAIAHVRGGEDMGRHWYESGKLLNKKNTFNDFIDCAEFVIKENYTGKENLCAMGGSAGGMLMGGIINMRGDLFKAVVAQVPFVDVVTTMLDESIPLTTGEFDEWGNPKEKEYYDYMLSYSPYDNVENKGYPAMLVTSGLHDSQVQYWEPTKWVARLRELKTDNNLLLLHTNMEAGHGGASGRFQRFREVALEYAFLIDQTKEKNS
jgi:oligopeptidase B